MNSAIVMLVLNLNWYIIIIISILCPIYLLTIGMSMKSECRILIKLELTIILSVTIEVNLLEQ